MHCVEVSGSWIDGCSNYSGSFATTVSPSSSPFPCNYCIEYHNPFPIVCLNGPLPGERKAGFCLVLMVIPPSSSILDQNKHSYLCNLIPLVHRIKLVGLWSYRVFMTTTMTPGPIRIAMWYLDWSLLDLKYILSAWDPRGFLFAIPSFYE